MRAAPPGCTTAWRRKRRCVPLELCVLGIVDMAWSVQHAYKQRTRSDRLWFTCMRTCVCERERVRGWQAPDCMASARQASATSTKRPDPLDFGRRTWASRRPAERAHHFRVRLGLNRGGATDCSEHWVKSVPVRSDRAELHQCPSPPRVAAALCVAAAFCVATIPWAPANPQTSAAPGAERCGRSSLGGLRAPSHRIARARARGSATSRPR